MSYGRAIATNTIWMITGKVLSTVLSLALIAALVRSLGVFQYGEFTTAFAFLTFFGVIADFGFFQILVRALAHHPENEQEITANILALRGLFGIVVYALAGFSVWFFPYSSAVKWGVVILAVASFLLSTNSTLIGVFQARHEMVKAVVGDVISRAVLLGLALYGIAAGWNLLGLFGLYLVANFLNLLITIGFITRRLPLRLEFNLSRWQYFFREAWPLGVVTVLSIIYFRIDTVILSVLKGSTDVGIYGAPYKIFELLTIIPAIFMGNVFPVIARLKDEPEREAKFVQAALDSLLVVGIGASVGVAVLARPIIRLVAGPAFEVASTFSLRGTPITAVQVLALLGIALLAIFLAQLWSYLVIAHGRQQVLIKAGMWAVILNVGLNLIFIPKASYFAATLTTILTELLILILWQRAARQALASSPSFHQLPKIICASAAMALLVYLLRSLPLLVPIAAGAGLYLFSLWAWGVIPPELWAMIRSRVRTAEKSV